MTLTQKFQEALEKVCGDKVLFEPITNGLYVLIDLAGKMRTMHILLAQAPRVIFVLEIGTFSPESCEHLEKMYVDMQDEVTLSFGHKDGQVNMYLMQVMVPSTVEALLPALLLTFEEDLADFDGMVEALITFDTFQMLEDDDEVLEGAHMRPPGASIH